MKFKNFSSAMVILSCVTSLFSNVVSANPKEYKAVKVPGLSFPVEKIAPAVLTSEAQAKYSFNYVWYLSPARRYVSALSRTAAKDFQSRVEDLCAPYNTGATLESGLKWTVTNFKIGHTSCDYRSGQLECETPLSASCVSALL